MTEGFTTTQPTDEERKAALLAKTEAYAQDLANLGIDPTACEVVQGPEAVGEETAETVVKTAQ